MRRIKRKATINEKKNRESTVFKLVDIYNSTKTEVGAHETTKKDKIRKLTARKKASATVDTQESSSVKVSFRPVEKSTKEIEQLNTKNNSDKSLIEFDGEQEIRVRSNLISTRFIVLDCLEEGCKSDEKSKKPSSNMAFKLTPNYAKKATYRRKETRKRVSKFPKPFSLNKFPSTGKKIGKYMNATVKATKKVSSQLSSEKFDINKQNAETLKTKPQDNFQQRAAGDGREAEKLLPEKTEVNFHEVITIDGASKTFLDICLPFTFNSQPEEDVSKIDGKYMQSLMNLALSSGKLVTKSGPPRKDRTARNKLKKAVRQKVGRQVESTDVEEKRLRVNDKLLHQAQNAFFTFDDADGKLPRENSFRDEKGKIQRNRKLESSMLNKADHNLLQLTEIKSEKIKTTTKDENKKRKTRRKSLPRKQTVDVIEIPFNDETSKVTEIWRSDMLVPSDNSLTSHSSCTSMSDEESSNGELQMKSYRTLQKIVEEEVRRICKNYQSDKKMEKNDESSKPTSDQVNPMAGDTSPAVVSSGQALRKPKTPKVELINLEKGLGDKLTVDASPNLYEVLNPNEGAVTKMEILQPTETKDKKNKLDELKVKLKHLTEETEKSGEIPSEIVKNWSIIRRLEKAFLALGTPTFPSRNLRNVGGDKTPPHSNPHGDATRKLANGQNKRIKPKEKLVPETPYKSPIASVKEANLRRKRIDANDQFEHSDIYYCSFDPSPQPRERIPLTEVTMRREGKPDFQKKSENAKKTVAKSPDETLTPLRDKRQQSFKTGQVKNNASKDSSFKQSSKHQAIDPKSNRPDMNVSLKPVPHATDKLLVHSTCVRTSSKVSTCGEYSMDNKLSFSKTTVLERKETFDVIPNQNVFDIMSKSLTKLYNSCEIRGTEPQPSKINKQKSISGKELTKKPPTPTKLKSQIPSKAKASTTKWKNPMWINSRGPDHVRKYEGECRSSEIGHKLHAVASCHQNEGKYMTQSKTEICTSTQERSTSINPPLIRNVSTLTIRKSRPDTLVPTHVDTRNQWLVDSSTSTAHVLQSITEPVKSFVYDEQGSGTPLTGLSTASCISTNTFDVQVPDASDNVSVQSSVTNVSSRTFCVVQIKKELDTGLGKCSWERDIKQYREIVKDIMGQYKRTKDFLTQGTVPFSSSALEKDKDDEMDCPSDWSNIVEYRKKILSEYNAVPLVEYKSRILENLQGEDKSKRAFLQRNLSVAKKMVEESDSDVKDYKPNVQTILNSQLYVDTESIEKRLNQTGKVSSYHKQVESKTKIKEEKSTHSKSLCKFETDTPKWETPISHQCLQPVSKSVLNSMSSVTDYTD
ncbi:hypothetical protein RUM44_011030 [Polyplax serrata]|uniref:Uncharacterized protein n=1 Tax=Polyplax serrata TaxID=468196 RepID=A0ABR1ANW1_POLSC